MKIEEIELNKIKENPYQTRETIEKEPLKVLVRSIQQRGLFNPISVLKDGEEYIIISGYRRFNAFKSLRRKTIPSIVKQRTKENKLIVDLIHENLVREDLTPIEKALSIKLLFSEIKGTKGNIDRMLSLINSLKNYEKRDYLPKFRREQTKGFEDDDIFRVDKILKNIGISKNNAYIYLTILQLPKYIRKEICYGKRGLEDKGKISVRKTEQLARIMDKKYQEWVFERAKENTTAKHIQALCDMFIQKVESGEWKGFVKKGSGYRMRFKDEIQELNNLSKECINLSAKISSFKVDTLLKLELIMEKDIFIASMVDLKRELERLRNLINVKMAKKGFREIKKDVLPFVLTLHKTKRGKFEKRFTFPILITKELNLPTEKDVKLKVKIIGIQENGKTK